MALAPQTISATNSTPFLASNVPLSLQVLNPFAQRPHHGTFQPTSIDELSTHGLGSAHHSSEGVFTRVFVSSLYPSLQSLPPPPSDQSFALPPLLHSSSDHLPGTSHDRAPPPIYQDDQVHAVHMHVVMVF